MPKTSKVKRPQMIDLKQTLRIVEGLEKQATKAEDAAIKKILLSAGCQIADRVLQQESELAKAA